MQSIFYFLAIRMIQISTNETPRNKVFQEYYLVAEAKNKQVADLHRPQVGQYRVWDAEKSYGIPEAGVIKAVI